jgi:TetR/AcrR family transcriptional regulator, transcriptional repressor for nem operon
VKVSKATAAAHRQALLAAASRLFREKGFDRVGIADIAAEAGLTHGAFYTHFASKEALCVEAVAAIARQGVDAVREAPDFDTYLTEYLSPLHVVTPREGCGFAALGGDGIRQGDEVRAAFARGAAEIIESFADVLGKGQAQRSVARALAIQSIAALVGGLQLARMVKSEAERDEVLTAVRVLLDSLRPATLTHEH